ncbi:hypothetical protein BSKO_12413 [Bryopsis sp. KO-2023]|nr:hypothetical protein BSKO_12413 [Bryopsis sp. KO-2023]
MARRRGQKRAIGTRLVSPGVAVSCLTIAIAGLVLAVESRVLFQNENNGGGSGGGFLAEELPLEIVTTTPAAISTAIDEVEVEADQALTVVFSRPVISLGQDFGTGEPLDDKVPFTLTPEIPGRFQWVSTYIARWDPEDGWPLDMDVQFEWNRNLTTPDGIPLRLGENIPGGFKLMTPTLRMTLWVVISEKSESLTDGEWLHNMGLDTDHLPEVPPDGVIELRFDSPVSIAVLNSELKVLDEKFEVVENLKLNSKPCKKSPAAIVPVALCKECEADEINGGSKEEDECFEVVITGDLEVGKLYYLSLAEGVKYGSKTGPMRKEKRLSFGGLREFTIPWKSSELDDVSSRALNMWFPHGLENGEKDLEKFKNQIRLTTAEDEEIDFKLTMKNKGKVQMYANLLPSQTYNLSVSGSDSILDGYGLPLQASSPLIIKTGGLSAMYKPMITRMRMLVFEADQDWGKKIVTVWKGNGGNPRCTLKESQSKVNIFQVLSNESLKAVMLKRVRFPLHDPLLPEIKDPVLKAVPQTNDKIGEIVEANISKFLEPTGIVAYEYCQERMRAFVLMESFIQAMVVGADTGIVWVTSMKTGEPIEGATVTVYEHEEKSGKTPPTVSELKEVSTGMTDKDGLVMVEEHLDMFTHVHIEYQKRSLIVSRIHYGYFDSDSDSTRVVIVLDRKFVRPGETLHVKGYILDHDGKSWKPSVKDGYAFSVFSSSPEFQIDSAPIEPDEKFGTFELSIPLPENATLSTYDAKPDSNIQVELTVESFIGSVVGDAQVTLEWTVKEELLFRSRLELADIVASLILTASTDIPGQEFGVGVSLTDLAGFPLEPMPVTVKLKKLPEEDEEAPSRLEKSSEPIEGDVEESCDVETGMGVGKGRWVGYRDDFLTLASLVLNENSGEWCRFKLPGLGNFALEVCIIALDDFAFSEFSIELGAICEFNCLVTVGVSIPRQTEGVAFTQSEVPVSKLFDLAAPHFVELSEIVRVEQDFSMDVRIPFPKASPDQNESSKLVVPPGESTPIKIEVEGNDGEAVEVTVIAVDKAALELVPLGLRDLAMEFLVAYHFAYFSFGDSSRHLVAPKAIQVTIDNFLAKARLDPWFVPSLNLVEDDVIDLTSEEYLDQESEDITFLLKRFSGSLIVRIIGGVPGRPPRPLPPAPPPPPSGGESSSTLAARIQEKFVSTPLFETTVSNDGAAEVNFTAPHNLGTFVIRAYAVSGGGRFGSAENELIVRREVSLTPSAPRFVRLGDEFEAGAVITVVSGTKRAPTVDVKVMLEGERGELLEILDESEASVEIGGDGTSEVRFRFKAKSVVGDAAFKITADDGSGGGDALVINFPVEGLQESTTLASSFAIDGGNASSWQEGLNLPDAVAGSGGVNIQAGVGRLPSILSLARQICERNPSHECPISADHALALAAIPFITESYDVLGLDRNELEHGAAGMLDGMISNFTAAIETLKNITYPELGLTHTMRCPSSFNQNAPPREAGPSISQNARGAWIMSELGEDVRDSLLDGAQEGVVSLAVLEENWLAALEAVLIEEAIESRNKRNIPISVHIVAFARAVLRSWSPPQSIPTTVVDDLSMERLSNELDEMGVESQAYYVLELLRRDPPLSRHPDVKIVIDSWTSNFKATGTSAYVAASLGSSTPASNVANSLVLMAMTRAGVSNPLIEKLANYVGSPFVGEYGFRRFSDFDKTTAMIALRIYDRSRGSTMPDVSVTVRSGEVVLMNATFKQNSSPVESTTTPWQDLDTPPKPLEFTAEGTGEVTVAASLTFIPKRLLAFPTYRGIFLERAIRMPESNGPTLKKVPVGSVVVIEVQLTTPDRLGLTTLSAMVPAGLEPVDPRLDDPESDSFCPIANIQLESGRHDVYLPQPPSFFFTCPDQVGWLRSTLM